MSDALKIVPKTVVKHYWVSRLGTIFNASDIMYGPKTNLSSLELLYRQSLLYSLSIRLALD